MEESSFHSDLMAVVMEFGSEGGLARLGCFSLFG